MTELPIHPQTREAPAVSLERRRKRLSDAPPEHYLSALNDLRRAAAVETLLLTGEPSGSEDPELVESQLDALRFIEAAAAEAQEPSLTHLREVHRRANPGMDGELRAIEQPSQFNNARPSHPAHVEAKLDNMRHWLSSATGREMMAPERMALFFPRFLEIAPFPRGNFRTAHLFLTFFSSAAGYPPVFLDRADADVLKQEVERAMQFDTAPLVERFVRALTRSLDTCEAALEAQSHPEP